MNAWERSWHIARTSLTVVRQDSEMLWFPILSGFFSLLFSAALLVPTVLLQLLDKASSHLVFGPLQYAALFASYFGLAFIATFFNVCVVYTTRVRLAGGDATFADSVKFAASRVHLILGWSVVAASVGLLLRALDEVAERGGVAGKILLSILRALLASAWSVATIFVVPAMVYKDMGPLDAIRESFDTVRRTWGESLIRYYGMGLVSFVCSVPFLVLLVAGFVLIGQAPAAGVAVVALALVGLLAVGLVFGVATTVFNTVLYEFAARGAAPAGFDASTLRGAFMPRGT